ncbi:hypothetical protein FRB99_005988 [Tulasnella sp. 403]|nr:hypothetical protein FRB99_005988 [Tulasnella sp. 403]
MFATQTTAIGTAPPRPSKRAVTASPADSPTRLSHRGFTARVLLSESQTPCPVYRVEYDAHNDDMSTDIADKRIITAILRPGRTKPAIRHGVKLSQTRIKPFMFSKLKLTGEWSSACEHLDDESLADPDDPRTQDIGTIRIEIKYIRLGDVVPIVRGSINEIGLVHEKAKKAGVHTTTFQSIKRIDKSRSVETAPLYPDDEWEHHVVFVFRYRSAGE